jgi:hypothetical protein
MEIKRQSVRRSADPLKARGQMYNPRKERNLEMKRKLRLIALLSAALFGARADAATTTVSIVINSPTSTTVTCPLTTYTAPLAAGSTICAIAVAPNGWSGALALSGTNASSFALSGSNLVVGSTALAAGTYSATITATP